MLTTIKFHNKATLRTAEVYNEATNGMLSPELCPTQLSITQPRPELPLGFGLITT